MSKSVSKQGQMGTLRRVLRYLNPYRIFLLLSLLTAAASVATQLYVPILTGDAIDRMLGQGCVDLVGVVTICRNILFTIAITALAQWVLGVCNNHVVFCVTRDLRTAAMSRLQSIPLGVLDAHSTGDLLSRMVADVDQFADGLLMGFTQLFTGVLTILGTFCFMLSVNRPITLVVLLVTPLSLVVAALIAKYTYNSFQTQNRVRGRQTGFINEMVEGQSVVRVFGREAQTLEEFDALNDELCQVSRKAVFLSSLTNPSTRFINGLVYAGVGLVGALAAIGIFPGGSITVGQLSIFLSYANQYTKPFNEISGVVTELQNALSCAARVFELLDTPEQTPDAPDARVLQEESVDGTVTLDQVSFRYVPDRPLIEQFSLAVQPGQRVAIVGPTGCGKTTLINLLMRFYDVDGGSISVSGTDIRHITRPSLRRSYGMVLQETWLKSGTILENISYGKPEASREEVIAAAKAAHAHGFISRLPQGYDTQVGEDGGQLSQGQKQLLCIARVMLCLPPMLILDEATSSIDTRTEVQIQDAFSRMMVGRTSFIVAHRLSTIRNADIILVMQDGHIVEQGDHDSLFRRGGFYARLYQSQFDRTVE
jgi:ATP-binding cassette subfamily B protein